MPRTYTTRPAHERVLEKVEVVAESGCWIFTGSLDPDGYGRVTESIGRVKKLRYAHRVVYQALRPGIESNALDHLCEVKCCVNPSHIEPVTVGENIRRAYVRRTVRGESWGAKVSEKTRCVHGHVLSEVGVYKSVRSSGYVQITCRACAREQRKGKVLQ